MFRLALTRTLLRPALIRRRKRTENTDAHRPDA